MNTTNQNSVAGGAAATAPAAGALPKPAPLAPEELAKDIAVITGLIAKWKASSLTGQLSIAIGGLHRAVEYAEYHLKLGPIITPPPMAPPK